MPSSESLQPSSAGTDVAQKPPPGCCHPLRSGSGGEAGKRSDPLECHDEESSPRPHLLSILPAPQTSRTAGQAPQPLASGK